MTRITLSTGLIVTLSGCLLLIAASVSVALELPKVKSSSNAAEVDDLVKIHESPKPIECSGVKQNELAPESRIVGIHFVTDATTTTTNLTNINQNALLLSPKKQQPAKQSQEFEIGPEQQSSTPPTVVIVETVVSTSTSQPSDISSSSNNASCDSKPQATGDNTSTPTTVGEIAVTSTSELPATTTSTTTTTTTTTPAPVSEPNVVVDAPVGTKTIRQGDAVYCGEANPNGKSNKRLVLDRIVGGRKTEPGEFPFQVRLNIRSRRGSGICGGVILDKYHILTAAHCMTACASQYLTTATIENTGVHATIGDHSIKSNDGEIELEVDRIIPHEKYDACNFYANDHDIALIKTSAPIEYRFTTDGYGSINRPCMPKDSELGYREGESVIVSGWGVTRENSGSLSNILRYVQVPIVNTTKCQETYGSRVTKDHVCAGYQAGGKDSCQGDSGGPLVRVVDNRYELVGIVSFGYGCGQPGAPGVYTRVASYIDWIKANM